MISITSSTFVSEPVSHLAFSAERRLVAASADRLYQYDIEKGDLRKVVPLPNNAKPLGLLRVTTPSQVMLHLQYSQQHFGLVSLDSELKSQYELPVPFKWLSQVSSFDNGRSLVLCGRTVLPAGDQHAGPQDACIINLDTRTIEWLGSSAAFADGTNLYYIRDDSLRVVENIGRHSSDVARTVISSLPVSAYISRPCPYTSIEPFVGGIYLIGYLITRIFDGQVIWSREIQGLSRNPVADGLVFVRSLLPPQLTIVAEDNTQVTSTLTAGSELYGLDAVIDDGGVTVACSSDTEAIELLHVARKG